MNEFHSTAVVSEKAIFGHGNVVGPHCIISGNVRIGNENLLGPGVVLGELPRQRAHRWAHGYKSSLSDVVEIGDECHFEANVVVHAPVALGTFVGSRVALGAFSYIAHDAVICDDAIVSANACVGGFVIVGEGANLGLAATVHPRLAVGGYSMIGMNATVTCHVRPGSTVVGTPAAYLKPNLIGLVRGGFTRSEQEEIVGYLSKGRSPHSLRCLNLAKRFEVDKERWGRRRPAIPELPETEK